MSCLLFSDFVTVPHTAHGRGLYCWFEINTNDMRSGDKCGVATQRTMWILRLAARLRPATTTQCLIDYLGLWWPCHRLIERDRRLLRDYFAMLILCRDVWLDMPKNKMSVCEWQAYSVLHTGWTRWITVIMRWHSWSHDLLLFKCAQWLCVED